jgi:hypothetical protein
MAPSPEYSRGAGPDHGLVAGVGGLRGRPGTERDAEWLILRTGEGTADRRAKR